jgi:membrane protease YdiL (CAAX protease family)
MTTLKDFIKRHPLLTYYALTFAISWSGVVLVLGPGGLPMTAEEFDTKGVLAGVALGAGPAIAGLLMTGLVCGKAGYRTLLARLIRWRVSARWYAVALLTAPLATMAVGLALSLRYPEARPDILTKNDPIILLLTSLGAGLFVGIGEELGWTGFALPRWRLRSDVLTIGLSMGLLWGLWHFPLFWEGDSFAGVFPLALLLVRLFSWLPAYRVLMVWVYDRTESLLVVILMHAGLVLSTFSMSSPATGGLQLAGIVAGGAVFWALVAVVAMANGWRLTRPGKPVARPPMMPRDRGKLPA